MTDGKTPSEAFLRELFEAKLDAALVEYRTELKAMAKALGLAEQYPTAIDKEVGHLRELHGERFAALEQRLDEQRRADKEARDKAEESFATQLAQLERTHESRNETVLTMLGALEKSQTRIEGGLSGAGAMWGYVVGIIGVVLAALTFGGRVPW